jgi:hypothetical protein
MDRQSLGAGVLIGFLLGFALAGTMFADEAPPSYADSDGDGIADVNDLQPDGDAHIQFVLSQFVHAESNFTRNVTLILGYNDDGDGTGTLAGQVCVLNLTLAANTTISHPAGICVFQVDDYALRSVSFEYRLNETIDYGHIIIDTPWDLYPGTDDVNPWGVNITVDPQQLSAGSTIDLNGLSDDDAWEHNARVVFVTSGIRL